MSLVWAFFNGLVHERTLKRMPFKANNVTLIPDGFLDIRQRQVQQVDVSLGIILEHDRGTEQQEHFRRRIRAYKAFLQANGPVQLFNASRVIIAFTTFISSRRVAQMREWTSAELMADPQLAAFFVFAELPKPLEPRNLLFERRWYTLSGDQPIALLEG